MSRCSPFGVTLSDADRRVLERRARSYAASHGEVVRAKIVLLAADGLANTAIAERLDVHVDVVTRWRKRFCREGMAGLVYRPRSGRPRVFDSEVVAGVKAMACEPPAQREAPLSATLVHLPVHASWLNQIEIVFSIIQRKVIKPADFADLDALAQRLVDFEPRYNATAQPFDWRFGRRDLNDLLRRLDTHRVVAPLSLAA